MNEYILAVTIKVRVESNLSPEEAVREFEQETEYNLSSTDNVRVLDTEYLDTLNCPL